MDGAFVGSDHQFSNRPLRVFVSADQKLQCEMFKDVIVGGFRFVVGKLAEDGSTFSDVLDEQFVDEVGEQKFHGGFPLSTLT